MAKNIISMWGVLYNSYMYTCNINILCEFGDIMSGGWQYNIKVILGKAFLFKTLSIIQTKYNAKFFLSVYFPNKHRLRQSYNFIYPKFTVSHFIAWQFF